MGNGSKTFICSFCQRELPTSKETEGSRGRSTGVCDDCEHRRSGRSERIRRKEGSDRTNVQAVNNIFNESGELNSPADVEIDESAASDEVAAADSDFIESDQPEATDRVEAAEPDSVYRDSVSGRIEKGRIVRYEFELARPATLEYLLTVTSGPNADIVLLDTKNLERWLEGGDARYYSEKSALDTRETRIQTQLGADTYYLVIDNSRMGKASPPVLGDDADTTLEFELEYIVYR